MLIPSVSQFTSSYTMNHCQVHSYPWPGTTSSHTLHCSSTTARYTHTLGQALHPLILYTVPAQLPGTLIPLVRHYIFSYTILFQHYCQVHSYTWSGTTSSHILYCSMPGIHISLVSHSTFSFTILFQHYCQVHTYTWSGTTTSHTLFCSSTTARYTHNLGHPQHYLIHYPVLEHTIQLLLGLIPHPLS